MRHEWLEDVSVDIHLKDSFALPAGRVSVEEGSMGPVAGMVNTVAAEGRSTWVVMGSMQLLGATHGGFGGCSASWVDTVNEGDTRSPSSSRFIIYGMIYTYRT